MKEIDEFLSIKAENKNTKNVYSKSLFMFMEYFNITTIEEIRSLTASDIRKFRDSMKPRLKYSSINTRLRPIRSFFSWLWKNEYISANPMLKVEGLKEGSHEISIPSDEEYVLFLNTCDNNQEQLMLRVIFELGFRISDVVNMKFSDIRDDMISVTGKGNKQVFLPLNEKMISLIGKIKNETNCDYVFSRFDKKISSVAIWKRFKKILENSGISDERVQEIHPHTGRHFFCSTLLEVTGDLMLTSRLMRHENPQTTNRYSHIKKGAFKNALSKISY